MRETRAENAAENKTEICPYGNNCPQEIIVQLKGMRRCGICRYAVRSIDHLPAIAAKKAQMLEMIEALDAKLIADDGRYTPENLDRMDEERQRLEEEVTGWRLFEEILEMTRTQIEAGAHNKKWVVLMPEIIEKDLRRVAAPSNLTQYVLSRLPESIAYPMLDSPLIRARFDILRRQLSARLGHFKQIFNMEISADPAAECLGLIRTIVEANGLTYQDLIRMLDTDEHLALLPAKSVPMLLDENETAV
jgi:hypothetical protein